MNRYLVFSGLVLLLLFLQRNAFSQDDASMFKVDTVYVEAGHYIWIEKYVYEINKDTFFVIPRKIKYKIKSNPQFKAQAFYDSLQVKASNKRWTKELYDLLIEDDGKKKKKVVVKTQKSEDPFVPYTGKVIRNIKIQKLDVFGPSVTDTARKAKTWTERTANNLHIKTIDPVIQNNIIIKEGDRIDPFELADNERILRQLPYIHSAKIYIANVTKDSADIIIVTKDVWSKAFGVTFDGTEAGLFQIWDRNLFGLGREVQYNLHWDTEETPTTGHEGIYYVKNMFGTFISGKYNYLDAFNTKSFGFDLSRPFYTPNVKYAGGLAAQKTQTVHNIEDIDTIIPTHVNYENQSVWLGRSFLLFSGKTNNKKRSNLVLSTSLYNIDYTKRPDVDANSYYQYHNRILVLGSIAFTRQNFYKGSLIYQFGKTEDIPYGSMAQFTIGPEYSEFDTRMYMSGSISGAKYDRNFNYYFASLAAGGFINRAKVHQGVLDLKLQYTTRLYTTGTFRFRHFTKLRFVRGINRYEDEFINLNNEFGIRGFDTDSLENSNKLIFNFETVSFTPLYLYGFRFVIYSFADVGILGPDNKSIFKNDIYSGIGMGIRIRNERLAFKTLQIRFVYYFDPPTDMNDYILSVSGGEQVRFNNFYVKKPEILKYY